MAQKLKSLGLALLAVFAVSATMASAALGLQVTTSEYPAILTGQQETVTMVSSGSLSITCGISTETPTVKELGESVTIVPTDLLCTAHAPGPPTKTYEAAITMTGCHYVRHGGVPSGEHALVKITTDIKCPEGVTGPDLKIWFEFSPEPCVYTIEAANNLGETTATNITGFPDKFSVSWSMPTQLKRDGKIVCGALNQEWVISGGETVRAFQDRGGSEEALIGVTVSE